MGAFQKHSISTGVVSLTSFVSSTTLNSLDVGRDRVDLTAGANASDVDNIAQSADI